jgi:hypothetical protein
MPEVLAAGLADHGHHHRLRLVTAPASAVDDRTLYTAMVRALMSAGYATDRRIQPEWRRDLWRDAHHGVSVEVGAEVAWLDVWRIVAGAEEQTEIAVTTVQQAVDVIAALTGVGHHLTTGTRGAALAAALLDGGSCD